MFYFGYGTLLDVDVIRKVAPSAKRVTLARLKDYNIGFATCSDGKTGGCTLDWQPGGETLGVQYELSEDDMAKLDVASGVPENLWARKPITLHDDSGNDFASLTFVIPDPVQRYWPSDAYVAPILRGAAALDLPASYRDKLAAIIAAAQRA